MAAEGTPQDEPSFLARPLCLATRIVLRYPWFAVLTAILLAVTSSAFTARFLGFRPSRLDLLNPSSPYNKRWLNFLDEFGEQDDVVVVVEGDSPEQITPVLDELSQAITREGQYFHSVMHKVDLAGLRAKGIHYFSLDELRRVDGFLDQVDPVLRGDWSTLAIDKQVQQFHQSLSQNRLPPDPRRPAWDPAAHVHQLFQRLEAALADPPSYQSPWANPSDQSAALSQLGAKYLLTRNGRMGLALVRISGDKDQFAQGSEAIDKLRSLIQHMQSKHSSVQIGLTGMPVLENDEMRVSQQDMLRASGLSLLGVACLFIAGFGGIRHPTITVATLILAIAWSFGYVTLSVGHLNILSVSFGVILIGLGIDFGIHYLARYLQLRQMNLASHSALVQTAATVGPGILTGGVTTALAFSTAGLTDFTGVAELGIIAGGGILLCIAAALFVLPAMLYLIDRSRPNAKVPVLIPLDTMLRPLFVVPRLVFITGLLLTAAIASGIGQLHYDHNLLNMQPAKLESVQWERRLIANSDQSVWFGMSMADNPQQIRQLKQRFEQLETVDRAEEIASLLPASHPQKQLLIGRIARRLTGLPDTPPIIPVVPIEDLEEQLARMQQSLDAHPSTRSMIPHFARLRKQVLQIDPRAYFERVSRYQQIASADLLNRIKMLSDISDPRPPEIDDLPDGVRTRFVGSNGRHLIKVYAQGNVWDMDQLAQFVSELESVDQNVTGHPVQTFYASRQMQQSYIHAAIYSLLAVAIVLMLDFCNVQLVLLALLPMALGVVQLFGLLGLFEIPLNAANMIVLPLILGIGIDDGVHVIHDFHRQRGQYRLSRSTATAVLITSATTMIGFGMMMMANHQGLRSLGQVLTIGVFCCLGTSIVILPALLTWISRSRPSAPTETHLAAAASVAAPSFEIDLDRELPLRPGVGPSRSTLRQTTTVNGR